MVKFPVIDFDLKKAENPPDVIKEDEKEHKKKPKPIMIDAWT
jgi:hypothetical protein